MIKIYIKEDPLVEDYSANVEGEGYNFSTKAIIKIDDDATSNSVACAFLKAFLIGGYSEEVACRALYYAASNHAFDASGKVWDEFVKMVEQDLADANASLKHKGDTDGSNTID